MMGLLALALVLQACDSGERAAAPDCNGMERPIVFAGLSWDSAQFHNHVAASIMQAGFGSEHAAVEGGSIELAEQMASGDIDVTMEVWVETAPSAFKEAEAAGEVLDLGLNMQGVEYSFLVPRYVIEGDEDRDIAPMAPNLESVEDLASHASVFQDPEQPDKGRYHNCIDGWVCERVNTDKLATYGLVGNFTNFRPEDADALLNSLADAYGAGEPWLGYCWGPTWVLGTFDLVAL